MKAIHLCSRGLLLLFLGIVGSIAIPHYAQASGECSYYKKNVVNQNGTVSIMQCVSCNVDSGSF